ncbi:MAG: hypothetical protein DBY43_05760 [Clostridiaceae bacterium]|nr:MAG: hypothetical protein DBY43_05760 [Clostridiaceae bacterium]
MNEEIMLVKNEVTSLLEARWMSVYSLYDCYPGHPSRAFESNERHRFKEVARQFDGKTPSDEEIVAAYNKVLAEEIENWIQLECKDLGLTRAEIELEISEAVLELFDVFGTSQRN